MPTVAEFCVDAHYYFAHFFNSPWGIKASSVCPVRRLLTPRATRVGRPLEFIKFFQQLSKLASLVDDYLPHSRGEANQSGVQIYASQVWVSFSTYIMYVFWCVTNKRIGDGNKIKEPQLLCSARQSYF